MATLLEWDEAGSVNGLEIDGTPSQGYESTAEVTEHPVESGSAISDHVKANNDGYTLEGIITNAPITVPTTQVDGSVRAPATVDLVVGGKKLQATVQRWSNPLDRVGSCDVLLRDLVKRGQIVRLTTSLRFIEDLIITRYKVERTPASGDSLAITLEFKQLRLVSVRRVAVPAVRRAQLLDSRGAQPPVPNNSTLYNFTH